LAVWLVIIVAESLHGTARELWLKPLVGDFRARQIAFFSGMALILLVALLLVRWLHTERHRQLLHVGLLWAALTLVFEFSLGVFVLGYSWQRMGEDYNLARGGWMGLGLLWLLFAPLLAARLRLGGRDRGDRLAAQDGAVG
jgi:apolipoprotein N-acyltransferase